MPTSERPDYRGKILKDEKVIKTLRGKIKERLNSIRKIERERELTRLVAAFYDKEIAHEIVQEAHKIGISLPIVMGILETETGPFANKNVFGCDVGGLFCNSVVTRERLDQLLEHIKNGGNSNGVGPTQITYPEYIYEAEREGGAHHTRNTIRVGLRILKYLVEKYGVTKAYIYYNGGEETTNAYSVNVYGPKAYANYEFYKEKLGAKR